MAELDLSKKLWHVPRRGVMRGICTSIARHLNVPVKLVRLITVLAMIFSLFLFVLVTHIILTFALDSMPNDGLYDHKAPNDGDPLAAVDTELASGEQRLHETKQCVASDTSTLRSHFRQL